MPGCDPAEAQGSITPLGIHVCKVAIPDNEHAGTAPASEPRFRTRRFGRDSHDLRPRLGTINASNLKKAHALIESGRSRGKVVLADF